MSLANSLPTSPRTPLRTPPNSAALVDWLQTQGLLESPASLPSFAQGLGRWLGWKQALPLSAALQAPAHAACDVTPPGSAVASLERALVRTQERLFRLIDDDGAQAGDTHFAPFVRHITAMQQAMDTHIAALRAQARAALAQQSPALRRLAALDAVMEMVVHGHEQSALAILPTLLERQFTRRREAREEHEASKPAAWLHPFQQDLRQALRAELALRLQPSEGLLDALRANPTAHP